MPTPSKPAGPRGNSLAPFRHRDFAIFWTGALVSNTGNWMQNTTVPFVLDQLTHRTLWVGISVFVTLIPQAFVAPLGGALADRYQRRSMLLVAQSCMMVGALALWVVWVTGVASPAIILGCVFFVAVANGMSIAAWQAFVPGLVPRDLLVPAIRLNSVQFTGARAVGPALAGIVLAVFGPGPAFLANAASFVIVLIALFMVRPAAVVLHAGGSVYSQFRDGLRHVWSHTALRNSVTTIFVFSIFGLSIVQIVEAITRHVFHVGAGRYGILVACYGIGSVVGSTGVVAFADSWRRSQVAFAGLGLFALGSIALGGSHLYPIAIAAVLVMGMAQQLCTVSLNTAMQDVVDEQYRGRAMSVWVISFTVGVPVGALVQSLVSEFIGLPATVIGAALLLIAYMAFTFLRFDRLRALDTGLSARAPSVRPEVQEPSARAS